jgi:anti-sigma regulatory factor (Ser/Thr protein kinase)
MASLETTSGNPRLHLELRPGPAAASESRHALDQLEGTVGDGQLEVLRLLVTELVSNSVRHGRPSDDSASWIELDVQVGSDAVEVAVLDEGPGFRRPETPAPHADRPGGWGLCLVDKLADRWGVAVNHRTRVWFEVNRRGRGGLAAAV